MRESGKGIEGNKALEKVKKDRVIMRKDTGSGEGRSQESKVFVCV